MNGEDKVIELLTDMVIRRDEHSKLLSELVKAQAKTDLQLNLLAGLMTEMVDLTKVTHERLVSVERRMESQERVLVEIRNELSGDVPKYDQVIEMETLPDGKRIILHRAKSA